MQFHYRTIILGGGASGLMLAAQLTDRSGTLLLEGNLSPGAKIAVSGGGRCNLTNVRIGEEDYYPVSPFVRPALGRMDSEATVAWFAARGVIPRLEKKGQYFSPEGAQSVLTVLQRETNGITVRTGERVIAVDHAGDGFRIQTGRGEYRADRVVVASGGISYPRLGASDIGYRIAKHFGHTVVRPAPALVGLTLQPEQFFFKTLSGIATEVVIEVDRYRTNGRLLFAHKGISGPAVLDASLYWRKGTIVINFLPGFVWQSLQGSRKNLSTLLPLPRRMGHAFLNHLGIQDRPAASLRDAELKRLRTLGAYVLAPAGTFGYARAEVTRGGVALEEIDPQRMESRLRPGLYFIGEVLDVTGRLGGYNLQWAWSSAAACAAAINPPVRARL